MYHNKEVKNLKISEPLTENAAAVHQDYLGSFPADEQFIRSLEYRVKDSNASS